MIEDWPDNRVPIIAMNIVGVVSKKRHEKLNGGGYLVETLENLDESIRRA